MINTPSISTNSNLEHARQLIKAKQFPGAEMALEAVIRVDPQNIEAWKTYLFITQTQSGLIWLKERMLKTKELSESARNEIMDFYVEMNRQLGQETQTAINIPDWYMDEQISTPECPGVQFELLDVFDYSIPDTTGLRSRAAMRPRRKTYNIFADIAGGILSAISSHPEGQRIAAYLRHGLQQVESLIKDPRRAYESLAKSPYYETIYKAALAVLFLLGMQLSFLNSLFGYIFLGVFLVAGVMWFLRRLSPNIAIFKDQVHVYMQQSVDALPEIEEVDWDESGEEGA